MGFKSFQDLLRMMADKEPAFKKRHEEVDALRSWSEAVGPQIAKNTRARSVRDGVLWVEVAHPIWRQELLYRKAQILERINQRMPGGTAIRDLFFVEK